MTTVLSRIAHFCDRHEIEYAITGEAALRLAGVPLELTSPKDPHITVLVNNAENAQLDAMDNLAEFSIMASAENGAVHDIDGQQAVTVKICGVLVDFVLFVSVENFIATNCYVLFDSPDDPKSRLLPVRKVNYAIRDLRRFGTHGSAIMTGAIRNILNMIK